MSRTFEWGNTVTETICKVGVPAGTYYVKVSSPNGWNSWTDVTYPLKVNTAFTKTKSTVSASNSASGIRLKWNKVPEGNGYKIYRKSGKGSYSLIKTITNATTTSYTDKSIKDKNGTKYTYAVRAYKGSAQNSYQAKSVYRMTAPTGVKVKSVKGSKISAKWKKNSKASGYQAKYVNASKTKTKSFCHHRQCLCFFRPYLHNYPTGLYFPMLN